MRPTWCRGRRCSPTSTALFEGDGLSDGDQVSAVETVLRKMLENGDLRAQAVANNKTRLLLGAGPLAHHPGGHRRGHRQPAARARAPGRRPVARGDPDDHGDDEALGDPATVRLMPASSRSAAVKSIARCPASFLAGSTGQVGVAQAGANGDVRQLVLQVDPLLPCRSEVRVLRALSMSASSATRRRRIRWYFSWHNRSWNSGGRPRPTGHWHFFGAVRDSCTTPTASAGGTP
jgi:hypothetical protein